MANFQVPTKDQVSENNQAIFTQLEKKLGFVPNLYAYYAKSDTALGDYLQLQNRKTSLSGKEKEIVNLVTSEINECDYCRAAHTAIGKMNGFDDAQILEIRGGTASFNPKFDALARFTASVVRNRGNVSDAEKTAFLNAGYTEGNLVDVIVLVGDKTISNLIHKISQVPIDFPLAPSLETVNA